MAAKFKKEEPVESPSPSAYEPNSSVIKPQPQRPINYYSQRTDFTKSMTGRKIGPGAYQVDQPTPLSLGKLGKSPKQEPNQNKNVLLLWL